MSDQSGGDKERREGQGHKKRATAAALLEAFARQYRTDREEAKRSEKHRTFREWLTIVGLFMAAVVAFFQWRELRSTDHNIAEQARTAGDQLKEIREGSKQTERTIAAFERLAEAAKVSAEVSRQSLDVAAATAERQLRAYLHAEPGPDISILKGEIALLVHIKNNGQTPANSVKPHFSMRIINRPIDDDTFRGDFLFSNTLLVVGQGGDVTTRVKWDFTRAQFELLKDRNYSLVICGLIEYSDIFDKKRTTRMCGFTLGTELMKVLRDDAFSTKGA